MSDAVKNNIGKDEEFMVLGTGVELNDTVMEGMVYENVLHLYNTATNKMLQEITCTI